MTGVLAIPTARVGIPGEWLEAVGWGIENARPFDCAQDDRVAAGQRVKITVAD